MQVLGTVTEGYSVCPGSVLVPLCVHSGILVVADPVLVRVLADSAYRRYLTGTMVQAQYRAGSASGTVQGKQVTAQNLGRSVGARGGFCGS